MLFGAETPCKRLYSYSIEYSVKYSMGVEGGVGWGGRGGGKLYSGTETSGDKLL